MGFRVMTSIFGGFSIGKSRTPGDFGGFVRRQDFLRRDSEATRQLSDELNRFLIVAGLAGLRKGSMGKP